MVDLRLLLSLSAAIGCLALIVIPLAALYGAALSRAGQLPGLLADTMPLLLKSIALAAAIAALAVVLGYVPGRLLGAARRGRAALLLVLMMHLLLPQYLLYYAWSILLSPTAAIGQYVSNHPDLARTAGTVTSCGTLALWYWPLAALLLSQGWRDLPGEVWDAAALDASPLQRWARVTLPMLSRPILLAFALCFALCLCEFTAFHLAGVETIGTQLAVLYQERGSESAVAWASLPLVLIAAGVGLVLWKQTRAWTSDESHVREVAAPPGRSQAARWAYAIGLSSVSLLAPVALLAANAEGSRFWYFLQFEVKPQSGQLTDLHASLLSSALAAALALWLAAGSLAAEGLGRRGPMLRAGKALSAAMQLSLLAAALLPGALVAVALLKFLSPLPLVRQSVAAMSAAQAARYAGVVLIVLGLARDSVRARRGLRELTQVDGATPWQAFWHVHLRRLWPLGLGAAIMVVMFALTELPATMLMLPAGQKNFAQFLLNQMHYARDTDVIATSLVLVALYAALSLAVLGLLKLARRLSSPGVICLFIVMASCLAAGCDRGKPPERTEVLYWFGQTGKGQSEFMYPRAIDRAPDGTLVIADKAARVQLLTPQGKYISGFQMPDFANGKPCGVRFGPDGNLYVADTHYHRVMVFTRQGKLLRQWGKFGQADGEFIFPTDVAFAPDGRVFVSEYGGNDRISVFDRQGRFLSSFGSFGEGRGQFSRPAAMLVDAKADRLYITDACNHRIAVYNLRGIIQGYIGSGGSGPRQLRYPYGLAMLPDGTLAVCEFGNSRIQIFRTDGSSVALFGSAGKEPGELAVPWSLAVDPGRRAYILDSGSNRVQVWQL